MKLTKILLLAALALLPASCTDQKSVHPETTAPLRMGARIGAMQTKSLIAASAESKISRVAFAAYDADGVLERTATGDDDNMAVLKLHYGVPHTIAALANFDGDPVFPPTLAELQSMTLACPSLESMHANGLPAAGTLSLPPQWDERSTTEIPLRRLVAKIEVTVDQSGVTGGHPAGMTNLSMRLHCINGRLSPFAAGGSKALTAADIIDADSHCDRELNLAATSTTRQSLTFYVPENMQGTLLAGNGDPFRKTPEEAASDCVTWLELQARKDGSEDGVGGHLTYRICPGADVTGNFDIEGNIRYLITLALSWDGMFIDSWKVERSDDWDDLRGITLTETGSDLPVTDIDLPIGLPLDLQVLFSRTGTAVAGARGLETYPYGWRLILPGAPGGSTAPGGTVEGFGVQWYFNDSSDRLRLSASSEEDIDRSFPVRVETLDGHKSWETCVTVVARPLVGRWDREPRYIAQQGTLTVTDLAEGADPSSVVFTAEEGADCVRISDNGDGTAEIAAIRAGTVRIRMSSAQTRQLGFAEIRFEKPVLGIDAATEPMELYYDGERAVRSLRYTDAEGQPFSVSTNRALRSLDPALYSELLLPVSDDAGLSAFARTSIETAYYVSTLRGEIWRFTDANGVRIPESTTLRTLPFGSVTVGPKTPACANTVTIAVAGIQPFYGNNDSRNFGRADDCSLLGSAFSGRSTELQLDAPLIHVGSLMAPRYTAWSAAHANADNTAVTISMDPDRIRLSFADNGSSSTHLGGVNTVSAAVYNYHSPADAPLKRDIGYLEIYVHAAIGLYMAPAGSDWEDLAMHSAAAQWAFYCSPYFLNASRIRAQTAFASVVSAIENRSASPITFEFSWVGATDACSWLPSWDMDPGGGKTTWRSVTENANNTLSWDPTGRGFIPEVASAYVNLNRDEKSYYNLHGGALIAAGFQFNWNTSKSTRLESYQKLRAATGLARKIYAPFRMLRSGSGAVIPFGSSYDIRYPAGYQDAGGKGYYRISYLIDTAPETNGWIKSLNGSDRYYSTPNWNPDAHH